MNVLKYSQSLNLIAVVGGSGDHVYLQMNAVTDLSAVNELLLLHTVNTE